MNGTMSDQAPPTVSHLLGEMTWLLTQSPLHRGLVISDLEWLVMPALLNEQFYLFRDDGRPVGLAMWARTDAAGEAKLDAGMIEPENRLTLTEWSGGDRLWLVDLVAPFATPENRMRELMVADLIAGPLTGQEFRFHQTDPATGDRTTQTVPVDASVRLKEAVAASVEH